jgi:outer membrane murein-binding lipoprotein Lpp
MTELSSARTAAQSAQARAPTNALILSSSLLSFRFLALAHSQAVIDHLSTQVRRQRDMITALHTHRRQIAIGYRCVVCAHFALWQFD